MISFFVCLAILIIGFMFYSKVAEKVFGQKAAGTVHDRRK